MDRIVELVQQLEPETGPPPANVEANQRAALLRSIAAADQARKRPRRRGPGRGVFFAATATAAAVAVIVVIVLAPFSTPRRTSSPQSATGTAPAAVLTAVTSALANTGSDIEEVRTTASTISATSWVDLTTGACRTDTSVGGQLTLTLSVEHGRAVVIDYAHKQWWTLGTQGVACKPLSPKDIEHDLAKGRYKLAGHTSLYGQSSLKLVAETTTTGLHPMSKLTTLWVNAKTYLPIQSTSTGHVGEFTVFSWLPPTPANRAMLKIAVPVGFQKVSRQPEKAVLGP